MELKKTGITKANLPFINRAALLRRSSKNRLMITRTFLNRFIILGFMVLVGYCLAKSIQVQSLIGILLALTSLSAGIYFLYLLVKAREEIESKETA